MLLFRDEEHVDRWCATRDLSRGALMTPDQAWKLAREWFSNKLSPDWRRHTPDETVALLRNVGLTGDFGRLP
jgi:hypothetical protein